MSTTALPTSLVQELDHGPGSPMGLRAELVKLGARLNQLSKLKSGVATIANGTTTEVIAVGAAYDGKPALVSFNGSPGSATGVWAVWDGSGNLTITVDTDPGADAEVAWFVDGRSASDLS